MKPEKDLTLSTDKAIHSCQLCAMYANTGVYFSMNYSPTQRFYASVLVKHYFEGVIDISNIPKPTRGIRLSMHRSFKKRYQALDTC